jgi:ornithine cyclodeaminase/alanine dehydrogenase-like protein (mu-crystallin family)
MIRLDEAEVEARLDGLDLVALVRDTLRAAAQGDGGGPTRAVVPIDGRMWFAAMPAFTRNALGAKLVVAIPENAARGLPTHRAVVVLFDIETGAPTAWVEAEAITRDRTAAVSVVATQALAARPRGHHAILGAGVQGRAHVDAFAKAGLLRSLAVWSRSAERADALVGHARGLGIDARRAESADAAVRAADVVTTCTGSATPLFAAESVADGAHVNAVGACVAERRELPAALVGAAALVADDVAAARAESGDVALAVAEGAASWDGVVSLGEVLAGKASARPGRTSVFISLGLGVEDVATAVAVVQRTSGAA